MSLVQTALRRFEDLADDSSRGSLNHHIEGRWQQNWLSATNRLQALQLVERLQELSRQMRLITRDLLQGDSVWKHAFPRQATLLGLQATTEHPDDSPQLLHCI